MLYTVYRTFIIPSKNKKFNKNKHKKHILKTHTHTIYEYNTFNTPLGYKKLKAN